jgi:hypothetical protein
MPSRPRGSRIAVAATCAAFAALSVFCCCWQRIHTCDVGCTCLEITAAHGGTYWLHCCTLLVYDAVHLLHLAVCAVCHRRWCWRVPTDCLFLLALPQPCFDSNASPFVLPTRTPATCMHCALPAAAAGARGCRDAHLSTSVPNFLHLQYMTSHFKGLLRACAARCRCRCCRVPTAWSPVSSFSPHANQTLTAMHHLCVAHPPPVCPLRFWLQVQTRAGAEIQPYLTLPETLCI